MTLNDRTGGDERQQTATRRRQERMFIREWRGRAKQTEAIRYPEYFRREVIRQLRQAPGFQGGQLSRRDVGDQVEFLVLTRWESMDAIREFTGSVAEHAVIDPGAMATLVAYDQSVRHYEVLEEL
jgi:heme-degrading monooxygenase HmoA